jgi:hypothetical protein
MNQSALETFELLPLPPDTYRYVFAKVAQRVHGTWVRGPMQLSRWMEACSGWDCYVQLNPSYDRTLVRPSAKDISHLQAILVDFDPVDPLPNDSSPTAAINRLLSHGIPPESVTHIDSGRGFQLWIHVEPIPIIGEGSLDRSVKAFIRMLADSWGRQGGYAVDPSCSDLCRLARLPGTVNSKTGRTTKVIKMGIPLPALWLFPFDSDEQNAVLEPSIPRVLWPDVASAITHTAYDFIVNGMEEPGRHRAAVACARSLKDACVPPEDALDYLLLGASRCTPALKQGDITRIHKDAFLRSLS